MNIKTYIESGILELYAMELLSPAEAKEVEALSLQYPEIKAEINRIQEAVNNYALLHAKEPRPELKQEILNNIQPKSSINNVTGNNGFNRNWFSIAALVIATIASVLAVVCYSNSRSFEQQLNQSLSENEVLKRTCNTAVAQLEFINNPNTKAVALGEAATVYWNSDQQATLLTIKNLPAPPPGKQYQLWSIEGNQSPKSAGLIDFNPFNIQEMFPVSAANIFAISLEDEGGSEQPTQVIIMGSVG